MIPRPPSSTRTDTPFPYTSRSRSYVPTTSGVMLGLGETMEQVQATLRDLRAHDVEMVTIGQYLQPSAHHHPVLRYWTPDEFKALEVYGMSLGFTHVASGPLVRSSYHADRQAAEAGVAA